MDVFGVFLDLLMTSVCDKLFESSFTALDSQRTLLIGLLRQPVASLRIFRYLWSFSEVVRSGQAVQVGQGCVTCCRGNG